MGGWVVLGTTWLGTVPSWLTFASVIVLVLRFNSGSGGDALDIQERANKVLSERIDVLEARIKVDRETIERLTNQVANLQRGERRQRG